MDTKQVHVWLINQIETRHTQQQHQQQQQQNGRTNLNSIGQVIVFSLTNTINTFGRIISKPNVVHLNKLEII